MPPKPKFKKEEIVAAALDILREQGMERLTARDLGQRLGASARPIFTVFKSMEEVKEAVVQEASRIFDAYRQRELAEGKYPAYQAIGMAYIRLAAEEKQIFRLLFMRDRSGEVQSGHDLQATETVQQQTGLSKEQAELFHTEIWLCVHGIAATMATSYLDWDFEQISAMITDLYEGLRGRHIHA